MPTTVGISALSAEDYRYCKSGDHSVEVLRWQCFLRSRFFPKPRVTGVFDWQTELATKAFQISATTHSGARTSPGLPLRQPSLTSSSPSSLLQSLRGALPRFPLHVPFGFPSLAAAPVATENGQLGPDTAQAARQRGYGLPSASYYDAFHTSAFFPAPPSTLSSPGYTWLGQHFGVFAFEPAPTPADKERIVITDDWAKTNIVTVRIPQLYRLGVRRVQFHKAAVDRLMKLFQSWERARLLHLILSFDGSYVARYKRKMAPQPGEGNKPENLSNHSWGTAFDINCTWNPLNHVPVLLPDVGCVRELAEIAADSGFYWGGHYRRRPDGMHFEIGAPATSHG